MPGVLFGRRAVPNVDLMPTSCRSISEPVEATVFTEETRASARQRYAFRPTAQGAEKFRLAKPFWASATREKDLQTLEKFLLLGLEFGFGQHALVV